jgi:VanZ family protein
LNNSTLPAPTFSKNQRILLALFTLGWAGLIFYLSTGTFGGRFSGIVLSFILHCLHIHVPAVQFEEWNFLFRKCAHLTEYCIFGLLIFATVSGREDFRWNRRAALWAVLIAGAYSLTDEFHQIFVPGRGPALHDSALDTTAAALGMLLVWLLNRWRPRKS